MTENITPVVRVAQYSPPKGTAGETPLEHCTVFILEIWPQHRDYNVISCSAKRVVCGFNARCLCHRCVYLPAWIFFVKKKNDLCHSSLEIELCAFVVFVFLKSTYTKKKNHTHTHGTNPCGNKCVISSTHYAEILYLCIPIGEFAHKHSVETCMQTLIPTHFLSKPH